MAARVGFLGGGLIATYHGKMLHRSTAEVALRAVYDPDPAKGASFAAASGAELVADEDALFDAVDVVYVCTWTAEHPRLVAEAARRGLGVFCEKPLATNLADAVGMAHAVAAAGVTNQVGLVLRDSPAVLALKTMIDDPASGRVMSVVFRDDQYIPVQGMYASDWRGDVNKAGAGTLLEHSIHDLDLLEWLMGPVVAAGGRSAAFHGIEGIEDVVTAGLEFASGALGTLTTVWHDVLERPSLRRIEVFCERAWFALEGDVLGPVRWTRRGGEEGVVEGGDLLALLEGAGIVPRNPDEGFIRAWQGTAPASPCFVDALRAHLLTETIYRSCAEGGSPQTVPDEIPGLDAR